MRSAAAGGRQTAVMTGYGSLDLLTKNGVIVRGLCIAFGRCLVSTGAISVLKLEHVRCTAIAASIGIPITGQL